MSEVSLIDGHIDGNNPPCKDCIQRHYNCHSGCEEYNRFREDIKQQHTILNEKKRMEYSQRQRDIGAAIRRGKLRH